MTQLELHVDRLRAEGRVFPAHISDDPWMLFHGTSRSRCDDIENGGLSPAAPVISKAEIQEISDIYEELDWSGVDTGGACVLRPFSLQHDLHGTTLGPVYLAETDARALRFASRDFGGGEKARAARRAIRDLHRYLAEPELRQRHVDVQKVRTADGLCRDWHPPDLDQLHRRVEALAKTARRCDGEYEQFRCGVVYAVRFTQDRCDGLEWHPTMGVKSWKTITPNRIVAKVEVPADQEFDVNEIASGERARARILGDNGLIAMLRRQKGSQSRPTNG